MAIWLVVGWETLTKTKRRVLPVVSRATFKPCLIPAWPGRTSSGLKGKRNLLAPHETWMVRYQNPYGFSWHELCMIISEIVWFSWIPGVSNSKTFPESHEFHEEATFEIFLHIFWPLLNGSAHVDSLDWYVPFFVFSITSLPIVVKGILRADDAELAVQHGVSAIAVSNHGGRQLDGVLATVNISFWADSWLNKLTACSGYQNKKGITKSSIEYDGHQNDKSREKSSEIKLK